MTLDPKLASAIDAAVDREAPALVDLARKIHQHPELCFEEHRAAGWIRELLEARGFTVEQGLGGMPTALRARRGAASAAGAAGARVAILAEYDALPKIGHACGHNLIAAGGVGAFLGAAEVVERVGGEVVLLGTPAEEGGGGKINLIEAGAFEGFDAAMMFHPFDRDLLAHPALAHTYITFAFHGRASHAAASPHQGTSALTACRDMFTLVDGQRVHFRDGVRVHGYILDGGQAVNIIVENASAEMCVRARDVAELERVKGIVERCARAAAMASDVELRITGRRGYRDMVNSMSLAKRFGAHLETLGRRPRDGDPRVGAGSTDMGDVSHVVPSIHPYLAVVDEGGPLIHDREFVAAAASDRGLDTALAAAKALARTAVEVLADAKLRTDLRTEWSAANA